MTEKAYEVAHLDELDRVPGRRRGARLAPGPPSARDHAPSARTRTRPSRAPSASSRSTTRRRPRGALLRRDAGARRSSSATRRSTLRPARSSMPSRARSAAPSRPSRTRPCSRSAPSPACRTRSRRGRRSSWPSASTEAETRLERASTWPGFSPSIRTTWQGALQLACLEALDEERDGAIEHLEARDRARSAGEGVRGEGRGLRLDARRPGVPGMSGDRAHRRPRAPARRRAVLGDGADALRHPVVRRQRLHRRGARRSRSSGSTTSWGSGGAARGALLRVERARDVHGQRRRDRRSRRHVRLRPRPGGEASAVAEEAGTTS